MVNIPTDNFVSDRRFEGAYAERVRQRECQAAAEKYQLQKEKEEYQSWRDWKGEGATVTISPESREILESVAERKAAQRAEKEKLMEQYPTSPFAYGNQITLYETETGRVVPKEPTQWLVFSDLLYKNGYYDDMSDEDVIKTEDMLKNITSRIESIYGLSDSARSYSDLSHEEANLEFISAVNALNYFADNYVPEDIRGEFKDLIKEYEKYNSESVAKHKNSDDLYSEAMKDISSPNATGMGRSVKEAQERTKAYQAIGKVTHTKEEEEQLGQDYQMLFDRLISGKISSRSAFAGLMDTLVNYASGGSRNNAVMNVLRNNSMDTITHISDYWAILLK